MGKGEGHKPDRSDRVFLIHESEVERATAAAHQALDEASLVDSTFVASRLNSRRDATRTYRTTAVGEVRTRAKDHAAARPTTIMA